MRLGQLPGSPRDDLGVSHFIIGNLQRRPVEVAAVKFSTAVDRPIFRHGFLRHLLGLGREIVGPCIRVWITAEVLLAEERVGVKQLSCAKSEVAVVPEMARQRDCAAQLGRLPPIVRIGVYAGRRWAQTGEQTRARRVATRRGTVGLGEEQAALGQAIHVRRPRLRVPAKHTDPIIEIVNSDEQHIWPGHTLSRLANRQRQQGDQET